MLFCIIALVSCNADTENTRNVEFSLISIDDMQYVGEFYYWCNGKKIWLQSDSSYHLSVLSDNGSMQLLVQEGECAVNQFDIRQSGAKLSNANIIYEDCFYKTASNEIIGITNEIFVELKNGDDIEKLDNIADKYGLRIVKQFDGLPLWFMLEHEFCNISTLDIANQIYELGLFREVIPNMLIPFKKTTLDTYYQEQWGLNNSQYPNIDISYEEAMQYSYPGLEDVIVAVIDDGVDTTHQDLNTYDVTYDAHTGQLGSKLSPGTHGTMVAGIIGAISNNYIGVAGVAPNVEIMPISLRFKEDYHPIGQEWSSVDKVVNAINFAVNNGADIINWSIGGSAEHATVKSALINALNNGRNGKGCVVVLGAGNENAEITSYYAKELSDAIVVGNIKSNGEKSPYSSYGQYLDVVAPGSAIYSTAVNNQYDCATGTSMATPFVSGIAALVLSKNPEMTRAQVVDVIESTSKKISTYTFNNVNERPYSWNEFVGYGLVDAYAALNATPYPPLPPSNDSIPIIDDDFVNVDSLNIVELTGITITAPKVYVGDIIRAGGVMIYPTGVLILSADEKIEINDPFSVIAGGSFEFHLY